MDGHLAEDEIHRAHHTQGRPEVIPFEWLIHVKKSEWHKHRKRNDFLQDLELRERQSRIPDPVGRHLQQVFGQCDAPGNQRGDPPGFGREILEVSVLGAKVMNTFECTNRPVVLASTFQFIAASPWSMAG